MLATKEFKEFANNVVLFLHNTSKVEGEKHGNLLREKGGNAYPTVSYMDASGRVLNQMPQDDLNLSRFASTYERLSEWRKLKASGDPKLSKKLFVIEMDFGLLNYAEAVAARAKVEKQLTDEERKKIAMAMVELEFVAQLKTIKIADKRTLVSAGKVFVAMIEGGKIPQGQQKTTFWQGALTYAASKRDVDLYEKVMNRAKKELEGDFRVRKYMKQVEAQLEKLKRAVGRK